ncbi:hypothetical protein LR48_Vigan11g152700 [Vigna angularis]|uniref:Uncharacterized protein n=1 Tax=Phaseolus angularis TaxID=3914 RepID=A0A0L9VUA4_PHAAN|nr:hypothetical protein LR48_Vigan11g152700 [Vigna angularis]
MIAELWRVMHSWWPLLLCKVIANGFHPTTLTRSANREQPLKTFAQRIYSLCECPGREHLARVEGRNAGGGVGGGGRGGEREEGYMGGEGVDVDFAEAKCGGGCTLES